MSLGLFKKLGKLSVTPNILPGKFELSGDVTGLSFPARDQACVRAGQIINITPALVLPWR